MKQSSRKNKNAGSRREKQKAETREVILKSAKALFESKGFEKATIRLVAKEAEVGLGTIFSHFPDKESLLVASLIDDLGQSGQKAWITMPTNVSLKEKMLHLAKVGYESWLMKPALSRILIREMYFSNGSSSDELLALDQMAIKQFKEFLDEAKVNGEINADTDTEIVARTVFSTYQTTVLFYLEKSDPPILNTDDNDVNSSVIQRLEPMLDETRRFIDLLFDGIGNKGSSNPKRQYKN